MIEIWVTHRFEGFHYWPDAPEHRDYLAREHRHIFHVKLTVPVSHDDREIEFHDLLDYLTGWCTAEVDARKAGLGSCEMIAERLAVATVAAWPVPYARAEVSEDGECGSIALVAHPSVVESQGGQGA